MVSRSARILCAYYGPKRCRYSAEVMKALTKLNHNGMDILAVHIKPAYRDTVISELKSLGIDKLTVMEAGRVYEW